MAVRNLTCVSGSVQASSLADDVAVSRSLADVGLCVGFQESRGRFLYTTRSFSPGEVIMENFAYAAVLNEQNFESRCHYCFKPSTGLKRCKACRLVWYCSVQCQKEDWREGHAKECSVLPRLEEKNKKILSSSLRLVFRILIRKTLQNEGKIAKSIFDNFSLIDSLPTNRKEFTQERILEFSQMTILLLSFSENLNFDARETLEMLCRIACSAHMMHDENVKFFGTVIFPVLSCINHSCLPNSNLNFENRRGIVRASVHLPAGTEITLNYCDVAADTLARKKYLKQNYFFDCNCELCSMQNTTAGKIRDAKISGFCCGDKSCDGVLINDDENNSIFNCSKCGKKQNKSLAQLKEIDDLINSANAMLQSNRKEEPRNILEKVEKLQQNVFYSDSSIVLKTRETLFQVYLDLHDFESAKNVCEKTISAYEYIYPPYSQLLGLQYFALGKLYWYFEQTFLAMKWFEKALNILKLCLDPNNNLILELKHLLECAKCEAQMNTISRNEP